MKGPRSSFPLEQAFTQILPTPLHVQPQHRVVQVLALELVECGIFTTALGLNIQTLKHELEQQEQSCTTLSGLSAASLLHCLLPLTLQFLFYSVNHTVKPASVSSPRLPCFLPLSLTTPEATQTGYTVHIDKYWAQALLPCLLRSHKLLELMIS